MLETPIALIIFNRPDTTARVFESIRAAGPKRLLVIGDGPRNGKVGELEQVQQCRQIVESVDWDCEVTTNYSDVNLGCKYRVASGLDWAFSLVESLIILEDDCLPHPSFFGYCEQLLDRFWNDDRVMMISGDNFQHPSERLADDASYYFSRWSHIWGWASWRRAWQHFDVEIETWPERKLAGDLQTIFDSNEEYGHWAQTLDRQHAGEIDTWDFPWQYACWERQGLTILPHVNLVSNIGFREDGTHTQDPASHLADLPVDEIGPLVHPNKIEPNRIADRLTWERIFCPPRTVPTPQPKRRWFQRLFSSSR
ncbi:MAG: glycosyltransferase family 2 protein [Planctomycetota bacterium]